MNLTFKQQKGMTFISLVFLLGLIAFFVLLILKIGPIYLDHQKVTDALLSLKNEPEFENLSEANVKSILGKRFDLNYVSDATLDDVRVLKGGAYTKVTIEYEVVKKMAGNLSVLVEFSDSVETGKL
jgi:hypothetical protein